VATPGLAVGGEADQPDAGRRDALASRLAAPKILLPALAGLTTVVLWASAFVGIRSAGAALSPGPLALARLLVGTVALTLVARVRREHAPSRADLPRIALVGVAWFGAYNILLNTAERHVDAGTAAMILNVGPIIVAVLGGVLLKEGFPRAVLVGAAIAFTGTILLGVATTTGGSSATGIICCLAAAVAYSVAVVTQKTLLGRVSALQVTWLACAVGAVCCLPYAPELVGQLARAPGSDVAWALYLGAMPTAVGFTTWAYALAHGTAGRTAALVYLVSPLAVLLGWVILGEHPAGLALVGGLVSLAGVVIARRRS
jgi:drug/metabolite transporter (DMT)-like permease